jgi:N-acetylglucosaminyl-diphospho-decaprenol L-rhamnosyltransferase
VPDATACLTAAAPAVAADPACVAVVVHYRDADSSLRCVDSLLRQPAAPPVLVVDNASPDGSGERLAELLRDRTPVQVWRSPHNGGFGAGCNRGIELALRRWPRLAAVLLLNPDAELAPGALTELLATMHAHPAAAVVGCHIDDGDGRTWFANGRIPRWTLSGFHQPADAGDEHHTTFVTGACMLLRGTHLQQGLRFDERYFLYCEDADLCERVRRGGGELWLTQRARASHRSGGSQPGDRVLGEFTAERLYWLTRAKVLFASRHLTWLQRTCFLLLAALGKPLVGLLQTRSLRFLPPYWRGLRDGWRQRHQAAPSAPAPTSSPHL